MRSTYRFTNEIRSYRRNQWDLMVSTRSKSLPGTFVSRQLSVRRDGLSIVYLSFLSMSDRYKEILHPLQAAIKIT